MAQKKVCRAAAGVIALLVPAAADAQSQPDPIVTGPRINLVSSEEYARRAAAAWQDLPDRTDPLFLDEFIRRFPDSAEAVDAFTIRYTLVQAGGSIEAYNDFIASHPRRAAAQLAMGEVFALYREQHRLSGYLDFMRRYPNTAEAVVAQLHAQQLAFEFATLLNTVEAYDDFLITFPDAPQAPAAVSAAQRLLLEQHRSEYEGKKAELSPGELAAWINGRLRSMRFVYHDLWTAISSESLRPQTLEFLERDVLGYRPDVIDPILRRNLAQRMERIYYVVRWFDPYRTAEASDAIVAEARHQELMEKLEELRVTLERSHEELISTLKEEMFATREVLREGFEELIRQHRLDRGVMQSGFADLQQSMEVLHEDLTAIYGELRDMHATLADVGAAIHETNARLARLDDRLYEMHRSLVSMHNDMNRGFTGVQQRIAQLNHDLNRGFAKQHAIAIAHLDVARESLAVQTRTLRAINHGFNRLDHTMNAGFARVERATWDAASMVRRSNERIARSMNASAGRKSSKGGFFKKALGTLGKFVPVVGPVVGEVAGNVLGETFDKAVAGEKIDPLSLGKTALTTAVGARFGKQYPASAGIAGAVYDAAVTERRDLYEQAGRIFSVGTDPAAQAPWRSINETAATASDFHRVSESMGERLGVSPDAIRFAVERIF